MSKVLILPKSLCLQELPAHVMKEFLIEPPIYLYEFSESLQQPVELPTNEITPLHRLVKDNSSITVSHCAITRSDASKIQLFVLGEIDNVVVESQPFYVEPEDAISSLVKEVKQLLVTEYGFSTDTSFRLRRMQNDTLGLPLFHDRTVKESVLTDGDKLFLDSGPPVMSSQMVLYYSLPPDSKSTHSIVCRGTETVHQAIQQMVKHSGLAGKQHYLMTVDWAGEPLNVIYNTNNSLVKSRIRNGDHLVLIEGVPPPKDAVSVIVNWVVPDNPHACSSYMQWLINSLDEVHLNEDIKQELPKCSSWSASVDRNISVEELKSRLLPSISSEYSVPSVNHIRLRGLDGNSPGVIYKVPHRSLKQYKLTGVAINMLAEVLPDVDTVR